VPISRVSERMTSEYLPATPSGGINVVSCPDGWYWIIPLRDNQYSVGFVCHQTRFLERKRQHDSLEDMLLSVVDESPTVRDLLEQGTYQPGVRVEQDFSYVADSFCGPGYYIVGDAACFLDPLLSTGVHLAMYSGLLSAASILAVENGDVTELEAQSFYQSLFRNAYHRLFTLVSGVYQQYMGKESYFGLAQTLVREHDAAHDESTDSAFGELIAGVTDLRDASDERGKGTLPIQVSINEATEGEQTPVQELLVAAEQARLSAGAHTPNSPLSLAPMKMDGNDLYDAATGLYLVIGATLGIRRAEPAAAAERSATLSTR